MSYNYNGVVEVYNNTATTGTKKKKKKTFSMKVESAKTLTGGVVVEVVNLEQAMIAEEAGASAVVISDSGQRGIARMPNPSLIKEIKKTVSVPVMAKCRVGHSVEAQILEALGVDYIDENEVLAPSDHQNHIDKHNVEVPFCCGCRGVLGEALNRVKEGAVLIRTQGDTSDMCNIAETVQNLRSLMREISLLANINDYEVFTFAKRISAPDDLVAQTQKKGRLPVLHFAAGGIATPADAALLMQLGCDGVFVGSEIFVGSDSFCKQLLQAIVQAVKHYNDPNVLAGLNIG